jgi:hypothetical protein
VRPEVVPPPSRAASLLFGLAAFAGGVAAMIIVPLLLAAPAEVPRPRSAHAATRPVAPPPSPPLRSTGDEPRIELAAGESATIHISVPAVRLAVALPCAADLAVIERDGGPLIRTRASRTLELLVGPGRSSYTATCPDGTIHKAALDVSHDDGRALPHGRIDGPSVSRMPNLARIEGTASVASIQQPQAAASALDPSVTVRGFVLPGTKLVGRGTSITQVGPQFSIVVFTYLPWFELRFTHPTYGAHIYVVTRDVQPGQPSSS